ncbi:MFS transporter [Natronospora cellulosivora (SeqCode)]
MTNTKRSIKLLFFVTSFYWFSMYGYIPTFAPYIESLGASHRLIGLIVGSYGFTQMLIRIPLGIFSDRLNKRKIFVVTGISLSIISSTGMYFSESPYLILLFRSLAGASAATWVTFIVLFSSYFSQEETAKSVAIMDSGVKTGQVLAMFTAGIIAQRFGQQSPFILAALGGIIGLTLSLRVKESNDVEHKPVNVRELLQVISNQRFLIVSFLGILSMLITYASTFGFVPLLARRLGASEFQLGLLTTLTTIPGIFSALLGGTYFRRKFGEKKTIIIGFLLISFSCILVPTVNQVSSLYLAQILNGFGQGLVFPLLMGLSIKGVESSKRGTAMGFFQAIYGLGMFTGPVLLGFLSDLFGLRTGFWVIAVLGITAALLAQVYIRENSIEVSTTMKG